MAEDKKSTPAPEEPDWRPLAPKQVGQAIREHRARNELPDTPQEERPSWSPKGVERT